MQTSWVGRPNALVSVVCSGRAALLDVRRIADNVDIPSWNLDAGLYFLQPLHNNAFADVQAGLHQPLVTDNTANLNRTQLNNVVAAQHHHIGTTEIGRASWRETLKRSV